MDDMSPEPMAPILEPKEVEDTALDEAIVQEAKLAQAAFHPAWASVQQDIQDTIDMLRQPPSPDLVAEEYKIEGLGRMYTVNQLTNLLDRMKNAVEATERAERRPKGAK